MRDKEKRLNRLGLKLLRKGFIPKKIKYVVVDQEYGKRYRSFRARWNRMNFKNQHDLETWVLHQEQLVVEGIVRERFCEQAWGKVEDIIRERFNKGGL